MAAMKKGIFCIHGFLDNGNSTYSYFKMILEQYGIKDYHFTSIQGHGPNENINDFFYMEALDKVEKEYQAFKKNYDEVVLLGFSMGGAIAIHLAGKYGANRVALVAPALKYINMRQIIKDMAQLIKLMAKDEAFPSVGDIFKGRSSISELMKKITEEQIGSPDESYDNLLKNIKSATPLVYMNFTNLINRINEELPEKLTMPVIIFISENDNLVPMDSAFYVFNKVDNKEKKLVVIAGAKHKILSSPAKERVSKEIIEYLYDFDDIIENVYKKVEEEDREKRRKIKKGSERSDIH
jgi:carboxylesterase